MVDNSNIENKYILTISDLVTLPDNLESYIGCLVVVDHYSKWVSAVPIRNKTAASVIKAFKTYVLPFISTIPTSLLTDNGKEFESKEFHEFLQEYNIKDERTTPNFPRSNGAVERVNHTVELFLSNLGVYGSNWLSNLTHCIITYNHTLHADLGMFPSKFLIFRSHSMSPDPALRDNLPDTWKTGHPNVQSFKVNEWVLMKDQLKGHLNINKVREPRIRSAHIPADLYFCGQP